jgi:hypothetical protein
MNRKAPLVFLLGGHDLEMAEIRKILIERGIPYHDRNLEWKNANLSAYADVLNSESHFVGIELRTDIDPPANYQLIDHHNENADKPSALEQVAKLFGINLTRDQQLIAANDKGFIPAMEAMGATKEEIEEIRRRDREAQGVTEEDERLGELSIRENLTNEMGITIVESLTSKFSAITDRLYPCSRLLIYTDNELSFYGEGAKFLALSFNDLIKQGKAFSGGTGEGFFGINAEGMASFYSNYSAIQQVLNLLKYGI